MGARLRGASPPHQGGAEPRRLGTRVHGGLSLVPLLSITHTWLHRDAPFGETDMPTLVTKQRASCARRPRAPSQGTRGQRSPIRELPAISSGLVTFPKDGATSQVTKTKGMESEEPGWDPTPARPPLHCLAERPRPGEEAALLEAAGQAFPFEHTGLPPTAV